MEFRGNSLNTAHGHEFDERVNVGAVFACRTMSSTRELLPCIRIHSRNRRTASTPKIEKGSGEKKCTKACSAY